MGVIALILRISLLIQLRAGLLFSFSLPSRSLPRSSFLFQAFFVSATLLSSFHLVWVSRNSLCCCFFRTPRGSCFQRIFRTSFSFLSLSDNLCSNSSNLLDSECHLHFIRVNFLLPYLVLLFDDISSAIHLILVKIFRLEVKKQRN